MITQNGILDYSTNEVYPSDTGHWSDLSTWDAFTSWYVNPTLPLVWYSQRIDLTVNQDFNLIINTNAVGTVAYTVYTSDTGAFTGEEIEHVIDSGSTDVAGFNGTYVYVVARISATTGVTRLQDMTIKATGQPISQTINNLATSTLSGSITARVIPLARTFSVISTVDISVQETSAYNVDLYVSNYATSKTLIPRVVTKTRTGPTIALLGIDGSNKDGTIDVTITGLPQQYMSGNNLLAR